MVSVMKQTKQTQKVTNALRRQLKSSWKSTMRLRDRNTAMVHTGSRNMSCDLCI